MRTGRSRLALWLGGVALSLLLVALLSRAILTTAAEVRAPRDLGRVEYVGSARCKGCHKSESQSWHRTFHRTMTQPVAAKTVLGDFSGAQLVAEGVTSTFTRKGERFFIETLDGRGELRRQEVVRTVGSRRMQQYLTREGDRFIRLPLAWDIEERRWFQLNAGFLSPDGTPFNTHRSLWDANCIFCHNVKAKPGYDWERKTFASEVEELGVACEACHGPGGEHARLNQSALRSTYLRLSGRHDLSIVNPLRLPPLQRVQVCGHCHGQRLPRPFARIRELLSAGDPYTPGDDLSNYTEPIYRDSKLEGVDLSARFWRDGTPRLSAYEYQALLMTRDFQQGGLTCQHCHTMHRGDVRGMLAPPMRTASACEGCHADIVKNAARHSRHREGSNGTDCYACHLPKITFGLRTAHPTHRIQVPEPARAWRYEMPEACTLCHTDRTARWAAEALARGQGKPPPADVPADPMFETAENIRALFAGDVVQRALAAMALGDARSAFSTGEGRLWAIPLLIAALDDDYASVRDFAARSLKTLAESGPAPVAVSFAALPAFSAQGAPAARAQQIDRYERWWSELDKARFARPDSSVPLDDKLLPIQAAVRLLKARRGEHPPIQIGE